MATRLYVGNLSYDTTEKDLQALFEAAGTVSSCELVVDRYTSKSRGFAFVEMASQEETDKAIEQCNGKELDGRSLVVNEARPRAERAPRDFKSGGGFGGGSGGGSGERGGYGKRRSGKGSRRGIRNAKRDAKGSW